MPIVLAKESCAGLIGSNAIDLAAAVDLGLSARHILSRRPDMKGVDTKYHFWYINSSRSISPGEVIR
jgi:hypothetical protein